MKKTKQFVAILLSVCMFFGVCPISVNAEEAQEDLGTENVVSQEELTENEEVDSSVVSSGECGENLLWELTDDGTLTVSGGGAMDEWANAETRPWNSIIGEIKKVIFEDGVTTVGMGAFYGASNLTTVEFADSITVIGASAFGESGLTGTLVLPTGLTTIGEGAFVACLGITEVVLPDTLEEIGSAAFLYTGLISVHLPAATQIGMVSFTTPTLETITVDENNPYYYSEDGVLYTIDNVSLVLYPGAREGDYYAIPEGRYVIGYGAFGCAQNLETLIISSSIVEIQDTAFNENAKLSTIKFTWDAPVFYENTFSGLNASVYYPIGNETWTEDVLQQYGGTVTWIPADEHGNVCVASGKCGENLTWVLSEDGTLTVSGDGTMEGWEYYGSRPWHEYIDSVKKVVISDGITNVGENAFIFAKNLTEVEFAGTVTEIGKGAFNESGLVGTIMLPPYLETVGESAFAGCTGITDVVFPDSLKLIDYAAFVLTGLNWIHIPGATRINPTSFITPSLEYISLGDDNPYHCEENGVLFTKDKSTLITYPGARVDSSYTIPEEVNVVATGAFGLAQNLETLTMSSMITEVQDAAFLGNEKLSTISFTGDAPVFGAAAFETLNATVQYPIGNETWTEEVMQQYNGTVTWTPVDENGNSYIAFGECGENLTWKLSEDGTFTISGEGDMSDYANLEDRSWHEYINDIKNIVVEYGVTSIGMYAFAGAANLSNVQMAESITSIKEAAFIEAGLSGTLYLPYGLETIGAGAFCGCTQMTGIEFPETIQMIGDSAFLFTGLTYVTIPDSAKIGVATFASPTLEHISVNEWANPYYCEVDGVLFTKDKSTLVTYPGAKTDSSYEVPEGVNVISYGAFAYAQHLETLVLSSTTEEIHELAFGDAVKLSTLKFTGDMPVFNVNAFAGLNATVYYLSTNYTWNEEELQQYGGKVTWESYELPEVEWSFEDGVLTISGEGRMPDYWMGSSNIPAPWKDHIAEIETVIINEGITSIGANAFRNCKNLSDVSLPETLISIGESAFAGCTNLYWISLPWNLVTIDTRAFAGCSNLDLSYLPSTVQIIEEFAFSGCNISWMDIPASVKEIGYNAFAQNEYFSQYSVAWDNPYYTSVDGVLFSKDQKTLVNYPCGRISDFYMIPNTVEIVDAYAFGFCNLERILIPENVKKLINNTFFESNISEVLFIGDAPEMGVFVLGGQTLTAYYPADNETWTEEYRIQCSDTVTWAPLEVDADNKAIMEKGKCGENLTWEINVDYTLTISGEGAMYDWTHPNEMETAMPWLAYQYDIKKVIIEEGVTTIGECAFYDCQSMVSADIADTVTEIRDYAFFQCISLPAVELPSGLKTIGASAFVWNAFTAINLPETLETIGRGAFADSKLESIYIPASVTSIGKNAFADINVEEITVADDNAKYIAVDGVLYTKDMKRLMAYPKYKKNTNYEVPLGVTTIDSSAFDNSKFLEEITLPATLVEIGSYAFSTPAALNSMKFKGDCPELGDAIINSDPEGRWVEVTIYYPKGNTTWTEEAMSEFTWDAGLTFVPYELEVEVVLEITSQPVDQTVLLGESAQFVVEVSIDDANYQWQYSNDGKKWYNSSMPGNDTATLNVEATEARDGQMYRCVVTDAAGQQVISEQAKLVVKQEVFNILTQPMEQKVYEGNIAVFEVEVEGDVASYQWQYTKDGTKWYNSNLPGNNTNSLNVEAIEARNGQMYRCIIMSISGKELVSDKAVLTVMKDTFAILTQPETQSVYEGEYAIFTIEAEGEGLTYQWQYSNNEGKNWYNSGMTGNTTNTLTVKGESNRDGQMYRCIVRDVDGRELISNEVTLTIEKKQIINIVTQPVSQTVIEGNEVEFTVEAEGEGLTYQWQYSNNEGKNWYNSGMEGNTTNTLTVKGDSNRDGQMYRCIIRDAYGEEIITEVVMLTVEEEVFGIVLQPENQEAVEGANVFYTIEAEGEGLTYQWQYSNNEGKNWYNSGMEGNDTNTLVVKAQLSRNGQMYRCVVTNNNGRTEISKEAKLTVTENPFRIITHPVDVETTAGEYVEFSVEAVGEGLSYQWQYSINHGKWYDSGMIGANSDTLEVQATSKRNGQVYRCVITDAFGNQLVSDGGKLIVR